MTRIKNTYTDIDIFIFYTEEKNSGIGSSAQKIIADCRY